ncbi:hypothetical protein ACO0LF_06455 [Undibacterium sp. Di27W]|uniref:hypothetical protein n=1 Tax=Undibacterium sp. Di27W TaxID=3413036 RepID=UPI003BF3B597
MNPRIYFLACALLAASSFAAQTYVITAENLQAAKPSSLSLANVTATASGAKVVSYAASNTAVADFIKSLSAAGAGKVDLLEIKAVTACGQKLHRAEIQFEGDNSKLPAQKPGMAAIAMMIDGKEFRCAAEDAGK